jgi:hypothetical protein
MSENCSAIARHHPNRKVYGTMTSLCFDINPLGLQCIF